MLVLARRPSRMKNLISELRLNWLNNCFEPLLLSDLLLTYRISCLVTFLPFLQLLLKVVIFKWL